MASPSVTGGYTQLLSGSSTSHDDPAATGFPVNDEDGNLILPSTGNYGFGANQGISMQFSVTGGNTYFGKMVTPGTPYDFSPEGRLFAVAVVPAHRNFSNDRLESTANNGFTLAIADTSNNYKRFTVGGGDITYDGVDSRYVFNLSLARLDSIKAEFLIQESVTELDDSDVSQLGFNISTDGGTYSDFKVLTYDWGYVDPYQVVAGDITTPAQFSTIYFDQGANLGDSGVVDNIYSKLGNNLYAVATRVYIGDGATTSRFVDNAAILEFRESANTSKTDTLRHYPDNFLGIWADLTSSCYLDLSNCNFSGTTPWTFNFDSAAGSTALLQNTTLINAGVVVLGTPLNASSAVFRQCGLIDMGGANLSNASISDSTDTAGALKFDSAGTVTGITFTNNTVDLSIPATAPSAITLTDITFSSSPGDVNIIDLRSGAVSITISGGNTPTVRNDGGGTTSLLAPNPPVSVTVVDTTGTPVENARVYIKTTTGGGLSADVEILNGLTDASGLVSTTVSITGDQPIVGWARKSTGATLFKEGPISGSIDDPNGFATTVVMISDE